MAVDINGDGLIALGGTSSTQGRLRLAEDTDNGTNYIELTAPASVGSDRVVTFPDATTTVVGTDTTQTLTNKTLTSPTITDAVMSSMASSVITSGTSQASTSGTSIDFTGIPSWVKRITVMFNGVSTNGGSNYLLQLGDVGGVENTGYVSGVSFAQISNQAGASNSTVGYILINGVLAANTYSGHVVLTNISGNTWVSSHVIGVQTTYNYFGGGTKTLSDTLDRVRITTVNGTDTFDAGSINILFE